DGIQIAGLTLQRGLRQVAQIEPHGDRQPGEQAEDKPYRHKAAQSRGRNASSVHGHCPPFATDRISARSDDSQNTGHTKRQQSRQPASSGRDQGVRQTAMQNAWHRAKAALWPRERLRRPAGWIDGTGRGRMLPPSRKFGTHGLLIRSPSNFDRKDRLIACASAARKYLGLSSARSEIRMLVVGSLVLRSRK